MNAGPAICLIPLGMVFDAGRWCRLNGRDSRIARHPATVSKEKATSPELFQDGNYLNRPYSRFRGLLHGLVEREPLAFAVVRKLRQALGQESTRRRSRSIPSRATVTAHPP